VGFFRREKNAKIILIIAVLLVKSRKNSGPFFRLIKNPCSAEGGEEKQGFGKMKKLI
jgi:hypothetical protein